MCLFARFCTPFYMYINENSRIRRFIPSTAIIKYQVINMNGYNTSCKLSLAA